MPFGVVAQPASSKSSAHGASRGRNSGRREQARADIGQQNGFFHGGIIGGLAEAVMGAAAFTLAEAGHNVVGAEYKINLLSPALGLICMP